MREGEKDRERKRDKGIIRRYHFHPYIVIKANFALPVGINSRFPLAICKRRKRLLRAQDVDLAD